MAQEALRSCYRTKMDFYGNGQLVDIVWCWCRDDAETFPYDSIFVSSNWDTLHVGGDEPGEAWGEDRPWYSGAMIGDAAGQGPPCGTPAQWSGDDPLSVPAVPVPLDAAGVPLCCQRLGCEVVAGCGYCPAGSWRKYRLTVGPIANMAYASGQGTWLLEYQGSCKWLATTGFPFHGFPLGLTLFWTLLGTGEALRISVDAVPPGPGWPAFWRLHGDQDCLSPMNLQRYTVDEGGLQNLPAFVHLDPAC